MAIIISGWVLRPQTVMELQPLTSQLSPVEISWLSANAFYVVEHLPPDDWWLWPSMGCCCCTDNSDQFSLSAVIWKAQVVRIFCVSWKLFLKHQVNCNTVCGAIRDLPWHNIWLADNPVGVLTEHLFLLVGRYVPTKIITGCNKDKPWFDDECRHAFGLKQQAHLWWIRDHSRVNWEEFDAVDYELIKPTRRPSVRLLTEKWMFLWMFFPLINGGPLLSLWCSARVRQCLRTFDNDENHFVYITLSQPCTADLF